jgi:hypothetical protein
LNKNSYKSLAFPFIILLKKILFSFFITLPYSSPFISAILISATVFIYFLYLLFIKPFSNKILNYLSIFFEFLVLLAWIFAASLSQVYIIKNQE